MLRLSAAIDSFLGGLGFPSFPSRFSSLGVGPRKPSPSGPFRSTTSSSASMSGTVTPQCPWAIGSQRGMVEVPDSLGGLCRLWPPNPFQSHIHPKGFKVGIQRNEGERNSSGFGTQPHSPCRKHTMSDHCGWFFGVVLPLRGLRLPHPTCLVCGLFV